METMNERNLIIIILVVIGIAALWYAANKPASTSEYDARKFVINDAQSQYPEAEIAVEGLNFSQGSWKMKVRVTLNQSMQCPTRIHLYYDYPAMQFATRPPEYITKNCRICLNVPECLIVFPEEALIASHTLPGTDTVTRFLSYYPNSVGVAQFERAMESGINTWTVTWDSKDPQGGKRGIVLDEYGKVIEVK
jgi:hypothetical protein